MIKQNKSKKILSTLLSLSMLTGTAVFPTQTLAATSATADGIVTDNGVSLGWNKHLRDNGDGTYTLTFAAKASISHTAMNTDIYTAEDGFDTIPEDGDYIIQAWGSNGGRGSNVNAAFIGDNLKKGGQGGAGGYVEGVFHLKKGQKIAYTIGSNGSTTSTNGIGGGVNGDGGTHGGNGSYGIGGGGGYTAVFVYDADEKVTYSHDGNYILIAGGGGGGGAGHSSQSYAPDGGAAGNMDSASAALTAEQNNVPGTYYAGSNGHSNSDNDEYVGKGATNLPGEANGSVWNWIQSGSGNDWTATYNPDKEGGLGGDGNGRGGAGGAGFAGGSGGVQQIFNIAWNCGGGGGGSSFIASSASAVDKEKYGSYMLSENVSTTGGSVTVTRMLDDMSMLESLKKSDLSGEIGEDFEIVEDDSTVIVNGNTFSLDAVLTASTASTSTTSKEFSAKVTVKPKDGFAGGNSVQLLKSIKIENTNYTFEIGESKDTDYVNVPWGKKVTANTIYANPGDTLNTAELYVDDNCRDQVGNANYEYIKSVSDYSVDGISGETFTAPDTTTRYNVSYTVEATNDAAKVGTPADGTYSAEAIVDVSGMSYVDVDGAKNGYKKTLKYNADGTYDLVIEHNVGIADTVSAEEIYTDSIDEVGTYTTAGEYTHNITEDGYYLILLRGADGGDGGDTCTFGNIGGGHKHGFGGAGAAGGYASLLGKFENGTQLKLNIGTAGKDQDNQKPLIVGYMTKLTKGGTAGENTIVTLDDRYLAVASGGAGGGGAGSQNVFNGTDKYGHGYAAQQGETLETATLIDAGKSTKGEDATDNKLTNDPGNVIYEAGKSANSYVYAPYSVEEFEFSEDYYAGIKTTEAFMQITNIENIEAVTSRAHKTGCTESDQTPKTAPAASCEQAHKELTQLKDTAGVKIYKITREKNETAYDNYTSNMNLSGEISKYFTINGVTVTGATSDAKTSYANGGENETSTFAVTNATQKNTAENIVYTINLSPKAGFLGGNDVPVLNDAEFTRSGKTDDENDDSGKLEAKASSDYANVEIGSFNFGLKTEDKTIVKGDKVKVADLVTSVNPIPNDWKADYVTAKTTLDGTDGAEEVAPTVTTEYILNAELAPLTQSTKAIVASEAESFKQTKPVTIYVEYSVKYNVKNITPSNTANAQYHEGYTTMLQSNGYALPSAITVTMGENDLTQDVHYTYDSKTGKVTINADVIEDNLTIAAQATEKTYMLTYIAYTANGEVAETKEFEYTIGETIDRTWENKYKTDADKSADDGYEFYWTWQTSDGKPCETMPGQNVTVEGMYGKKVYVLTIDYVTPDGVSAPAQYKQSYVWGDTYSVESPEIDGYIADKPTVSGTMPKADVNVTVTYTQKAPGKHLLTIKYVYEDGTTAADTYTAEYEENATYSVNSPSISGYIANQTTVSGTMGTGDVTETVTYKEDAVKVTVTFDANGGSIAKADETKEVLCGNNHTYGALPTAVKSDAKFLGWFTEAEGGTQVTSTTTVANSTDHTLYAHWEDITAYVTYDANGGTFEDGTTTKAVLGTYNSAYPTIADVPTRNGYDFLGWYVDKNAGTKFDTTAPTATFVYTSPRTLYAGWEATDSAEVVFKNGGTVLNKYSFDVAGEMTETIPTPPTGGGYFKGWFASFNHDKGGNVYDNTLTIDYYEKKQGRNSFTVKDDTGTETFLLEYLANWYDKDTMGNTCVSDARAQRVVLENGKYIRFLALVDNDYVNYKKAGFVLSTECPTPTTEAGYQYSNQNTIYKKVYALNKDTGTGDWLDIAYLKQGETFGFSEGAGLLYTNVKIKDGNEDKTYYCTPYIVNSDDEYVYGKTRAVTYNQLAEKDKSVTEN